MKVEFCGPFPNFVDLFNGSLAKKGLDLDLSNPDMLAKRSTIYH